MRLSKPRRMWIGLALFALAEDLPPPIRDGWLYLGDSLGGLTVGAATAESEPAVPHSFAGHDGVVVGEVCEGHIRSLQWQTLTPTPAPIAVGLAAYVEGVHEAAGWQISGAPTADEHARQTHLYLPDAARYRLLGVVCGERGCFTYLKAGDPRPCADPRKAQPQQ